jgi:cob(I)alamin adenosyltransferase
VSQISDEMVEWAEAAIDRHMESVELPPQFVIPGGTQLSAALDLARAVLRRSERRVITLQETDGDAVSETLLRFVNRASDLVYAMSRATDIPDPELFEGRRKSKDA